MITDIVHKNIENMIYEIRGKQVMLDSNLAVIYGFKNGTKDINKLVKRNIKKFNGDMYFQLTEEEKNNLWFQNGTANKMSRVNPYVFTKEGIEVLSRIIKKETVIDITNNILSKFENKEYDITSSNPLNIKDLIYEIDEKQVILDYDLARLYECKNGTKEINQAVKRNIERFPNDFYFQLTESKLKELRSQFVTANISHMSRTNPYAFTEEGVAMLSSLLNTKIAEQVSVDIMRAFVSMRKYLKSNLLEQKYINNLVLEDHENIKEINNDIKNIKEAFDKLEEKELKNKIFFNGEIWDSYMEILKILKQANKEIIIIDNYADQILLDIITKIHKEVLLITSKQLLKDIDINKYNKQYHNLKVIKNNDFHDRYIILDKEKIYHLGSSINYLGNKTFGINIIEEPEYKKLLLNKINNIIS